MNRHLTAHDVQRLKKSLKFLNTSAFATLFYGRLFELHPQLKPMFHTDMEKLNTKLMSVLELVIYIFVEKEGNKFFLQDDLVVPLRNLGILHEEKGVQPAHYTIANNILIETLERVLQEKFTDEMKTAWQSGLNQLTSAMLNNSLVSRRPATLGTLPEMFSNIRRQMRKP